jgi:hypothetical protein
MPYAIVPYFLNRDKHGILRDLGYIWADQRDVLHWLSLAELLTPRLTIYQLPLVFEESNRNSMVIEFRKKVMAPWHPVVIELLKDILAPALISPAVPICLPYVIGASRVTYRARQSSP